MDDATRDGDPARPRSSGNKDTPVGWEVTICMEAAEAGLLDVLQWARENECPWDWRSCAYAAVNGHVDVLEWLYENGAPYGAPLLGVHDNCREFWDTYARPFWSKGKYVPVSPAPKPAVKK